MPQRIVFATNNQGKLKEIREMLYNNFEVLSLKDIGCNIDIPETGTTFKENALVKAQYVWDNYNLSCFADDSGLEVDALNGAPGIYSARYASTDGQQSHDSQANMSKLLYELQGMKNRRANFITLICLIDSEGKAHYFEGKVFGTITHSQEGTGGFGYDPVFIPDGYNNTFARLGKDIKNKISHRAIATRLLSHYLLNTKH